MEWYWNGLVLCKFPALVLSADLDGLSMPDGGKLLLIFNGFLGISGMSSLRMVFGFWPLFDLSMTLPRL